MKRKPSGKPAPETPLPREASIRSYSEFEADKAAKRDPASERSEAEPVPLPAQDQPAKAAPLPRRRSRAPERAEQVHRWCLRPLRICLRVSLLVLGLPVAFAIAATVLLLGQEIRAPTWVKDAVSERASEVLGSGSLDFGSIYVTIARDLHPTVRLSDVTLTDGDGQQLARLQSLEAGVSPRGILLESAALVQTLDLIGAEFQLRRAPEGDLAVSFDNLQGTASQTRSLPDLLDSLDAVLDARALSALTEINVRGVVINYLDERSDRRWLVDNGRIDVDLTEGRRLSADLALLSGRSFASTLRLTLTRPRGARQTDVALAVDRIPAVDLASQSPALSFLSVIDAPITGAVRASLSPAGEVEDVSGTLEIGAGALAPGAATPIRFDAAKTYLRFDPAAGRIEFDQIEVTSEWGDIDATGTALLKDFENGLPKTFLTQINLGGLNANPAGLFADPVRISSGVADLRLSLDPFRLELGQMTLVGPAGTARASGDVTADGTGWAVAVDAEVEATQTETVKALWPPAFKPGTRRWIVNNIEAGTLTDVSAGLRLRQSEPLRYAVSARLSDARVRVVKGLPPVEEGEGFLTLQEDGLQVAVDAGVIRPPEGGVLSVAGSTFAIPDMRLKPAPATAILRTDGPLTATLSLLDQPPLGFLAKAGRPVALGEGRARAETRLDLPIKKGLTIDDVSFATTATVEDVSSGVLVPNRIITAERLSVDADRGGLEVSGPVRIDGAAATLTYAQPFTSGGVPSVEGQLALSQQTLDAFGIGLPRGTLGGLGQGQVRLDLPKGAAPRFRLTSDLAGLRLSVPPLGWTKSPGQTGRFEISGTLASTPVIDGLSLTAPGLDAAGTLTLSGGGLERLSLSRLRAGGWLDAPVTLTGRGAGRAPAVTIRGGSLDLRNLPQFGASSGSGGAPITAALDRLTVTNTIALRDFRAELDSTGGLSGRFSGKVNGSADVTGTLGPRNGGTAVRIRSDNAGKVLRAAQLAPGARKGSLDLVLVPTGARGSYDGQLAINEIRLRDAPSVAALVDAISVIGLIQQLDGNGLLFSEVRSRFRLTPNQLIVAEASAIGPSLGVSLDGVYGLANKQMNFQGVASPFYLVNGIGAALTRRGEGLFGMNFNLAGTPAQPQVSVNPLSALTPGMFREIFRRPAPDLTQ
ncbi:DUF3971 domain-containing protein [Aestuariibius insulae]|uniref:YhdP family protein n=1 Tax=Aestuariibius insulae TaxID=2058287 RepID=UPI00345E3F30